MGDYIWFACVAILLLVVELTAAPVTHHVTMLRLCSDFWHCAMPLGKPLDAVVLFVVLFFYGIAAGSP